MRRERLPLEACGGAGEAARALSAQGVEPAPAEDATVITFPNGVRLLLLERPQLQSLAAAVLINAGSRDESAQEVGISHFLEHMVFKGTRRRSGFELSSAAERLGAEFNAYTAKDRTAYHISGLARHQGQFVELLGDMVCNSVFPAEELERERGVVLQEIRRGHDRPPARVRQLLDGVAFPAQPYGRPVLGCEASVRRLGRSDLRDYHAARYVGSNVIVALAGGLDAAAAVEQVRLAFAGLPEGRPRPSVPARHHGGVAVAPADLAQAQLRMSFPIASLSEDFYPDLLAASLLGDGLSAPLGRRIREELGLAYDIDCHTVLRDDVGQLIIAAATAPEQVGELLEAVAAVLREQAAGVAALDLERARNGLAVDLVQAAERPLALALDAAEDLLVYGAVQPLVEQVARIEAVAAGAVEARIARLLRGDPALAAVGAGLAPGLLESFREHLAAG